MDKFVKISLLYGLLLLIFACSNNPGNNNSSDARLSAFFDKAQNPSLPDSIRKVYIDSVYAELADSPNDTLTRFYYRKAAEEYYNLGEYDRSLSASKKIIDLAIDAKDTTDIVKALHNSGVSYYAKEDNDSAFYYYSQAEKLYGKLGDLGALGETVLYKAYVYYNAGLYGLCESEAFKALKLLQNENKTVHIYNCYNIIATALDGQDDNQEAIKYYNDALSELDKFAQEGYPESTIALYRASCYNNLGGVYVKIENHDKAIGLYTEALNTPNLKTESPALYAKLLNNLAYAKFKSGDFSDLPEMFHQSLHIRDSLQNISGIVASNKHLGEFFLHKQDTTKAIMYLKQAYKQADEINSHFDILTTLKMLSEIDRKNPFYSNKYITVSDSLQEVSKKNRDYFARIEYETAKLQTEKEELIKKNSFIIGVSAVILLFVAAIFIIYYLNSRNKKLLLIQEQQKANEEIYQLMFEQQSKIEKVREEEKSRIAMELHDGILNNIYAVRLNLEFINKKSDEESVAKRKEYIKELQKVEMEIRGVSHNLSRNVVFQDKNFRDLLESMITSQMNNFNTVFEADIDPEIDWENMPNTQKVNIYRIIQEGLQNINKYSNAGHALVEVKKDGKNINISIIDNGVGFDPDKTKGGIGIKNLKKRAASLNGQMSINSGEGMGSRIEVVFPH